MDTWKPAREIGPMERALEVNRQNEAFHARRLVYEQAEKDALADPGHVYDGPITSPPRHQLKLFMDKKTYPTGKRMTDLTHLERKQIPVVTGVLDYFPDAIASIALVSAIGNDQHNPGEPLHWAREKSTDEINTAGRHLMERGRRDTDGTRHLAKAAWRILAALQKEIEADGGGL